MSRTCNADWRQEWREKWQYNWSENGKKGVLMAITAAKKAPNSTSPKYDLWVYILLRMAICRYSSNCNVVKTLHSRAQGCNFISTIKSIPPSVMSPQECVRLADKSYQLKMALMQAINGKTSFPLTDYIQTGRFISRVIKSVTADTSDRDHWLINPDKWQQNHDIGVTTAIACDNGDRNACARLNHMINKTESHNRSLDRAAGTSKAIIQEQRKRQDIYRQNEQYRAYPVR